ncbi:MAG: amino acid ABC transporter ATP-binding protein [Candidatus Schmidhempelia sp.]|nr:amino acid ABC transporter ATP-binding protein [Candidatus Schmidhempelia sp.]
MNQQLPVNKTGSVKPIVYARNVCKRFGKNEVLKGVNLDIYEGEVVVILGPSGSGKTTFLRCINHLENMDEGIITVKDVQIGYEFKNNCLRKATFNTIAYQRRNIGMVFQQFNLYPHMTVLQNIIEAPISVHKQTYNSAKEKALLLLERVGLYDKAYVYPNQLSGGQQQRVAIARALAIDPDLILFDEPTSALDPELVGEVLSTMRELAIQGLTMVIVTHEIGFAREAADRIVFMDNGIVIEQGTPQQVLNAPQHPRTRAFLTRFI